jgi:hypothetical protein
VPCKPKWGQISLEFEFLKLQRFSICRIKTSGYGYKIQNWPINYCDNKFLSATSRKFWLHFACKKTTYDVCIWLVARNYQQPLGQLACLSSSLKCRPCPLSRFYPAFILILSRSIQILFRFYPNF